MVYRFKILLENNDEFIREIVIQSHQSFADFSRAIVNSTTLNPDDSAAFYICNDNWLKITKLTSVDIASCNMQESDSDDGLTKRKRKKLEEFQMNDSLLKDFIQDPHQKMIYESNLEYPRTFYIELIKITKDDPNVSYPSCISRIGELPALRAKAPIELKEFEIPKNTEDEMALVMAGLSQRLSKLDDIDDVPEDFMDEDLEALLNADLSIDFDDDGSISSSDDDSIDDDDFLNDDDEFSPNYGDGDPFDDNSRDW